MNNMITAQMVQAAERIVAALSHNASPVLRRAHQRFPENLWNGAHLIEGDGRRAALDLGQVIRADRSPSRTRAELSRAEAQQLFDLARRRRPDFTGTNYGVTIVDSSAGPAVVRNQLGERKETLLKIWFPENVIINHARECGARAPKMLYSGVDPYTGREFTIMEYVTGETRPFSDPEVLRWLPDLLDQVQLMSAHPLPEGMKMDIPSWQQAMIQNADNVYDGLPPWHRSRLDELGVGPLSTIVRPDHGRAGEPAVFGHNDLYPQNLRFDDQKKLWILDWENGGPSDPHYNATLFIDRVGPLNDTTHAAITDMWNERLSSMHPGVDTESALSMYQKMEDWRGLVLSSGTMEERVAGDPDLLTTWAGKFEKRISRNPDLPEFSEDDLRSILGRWVDL
ncbi:MAG: phosphotransferase [Nocardia sp.]|nr:phosphotransferase [Nocardia sp.]